MSTWDKFHAPVNASLQAFLAHLTEDAIIRENTSSPWIEVDIFGRYGMIRFAIWKSTGALHILDMHGAVSDDPIPLEEAVKEVRDPSL